MRLTVKRETTEKIVGPYYKIRLEEDSKGEISTIYTNFSEKPWYKNPYRLPHDLSSCSD